MLNNLYEIKDHAPVASVCKFELLFFKGKKMLQASRESGLKKRKCHKFDFVVTRLRKVGVLKLLFVNIIHF